MNFKVTEHNTNDGEKLMAMLRSLSSKQVKIGFQHGQATEKDGTDICDVAAWNELGTEHIPSRPFMRMSVDENESQIADFMETQKQAMLQGATDEQVLKKVGVFMKGLVQEKIRDGSYTPNAESTIRRKKSSKPLIDSGTMRKYVNYIIEGK